MTLQPIQVFVGLHWEVHVSHHQISSQKLTCIHCSQGCLHCPIPPHSRILYSHLVSTHVARALHPFLKIKPRSARLSILFTILRLAPYPKQRIVIFGECSYSVPLLNLSNEDYNSNSRTFCIPVRLSNSSVDLEYCGSDSTRVDITCWRPTKSFICHPDSQYVTHRLFSKSNI